MERIGLIAGNRRYPIILCEAAKQKDNYIVAVAIKGETSPKLKKFADRLYWVTLSEFRRCFEIFKSEGITKIIMAGQISPWRLFSKEIDRNPQVKKLLEGMRDRKANTIFSAIAQELQEAGFALIDSTTFMEKELPPKGTLSKREPSFNEWEDVYFGVELARQVAHLDIGQTVAVKNKAIVAVEAFEGTDNLIRRAGRLAGRGIVVVKVSRPKQDMRFDIPVVGLNTVKNLIKVGAACLAIEADKTLFIDRNISINLADKRGLSIVAI